LSLQNTSDTRKVDFSTALDGFDFDVLKKTQAEKEKWAFDRLAKIEIKDEHGNNYSGPSIPWVQLPMSFFRLDPDKGLLYGTVTPSSLGPHEKVYFQVGGAKLIEKATRLDLKIPLVTKPDATAFLFSIRVRRGGQPLDWPPIAQFGFAAFKGPTKTEPLYIGEGGAEEIAKINAAQAKQKKELPGW
jgi:hypothetical protein